MGGGNNLVAGNLIGTDVSGTKDLGNAHDGVVIVDTTDTGVVVATTGNNTVGGTTATARNVISGNDGNGVAIVGATEVGNLVLGNYIGTNIHGEMDPGVDLGNSLDGVIISRFGRRRPYRVQQPDRRDHGRGTQRHFRQPPGRRLHHRRQRAGREPGAGELTSAPTRRAFERLGNGRSGVRLYSLRSFTDSASNNTIGGSVAGAGNLISANGESGVAILGGSTGGTGNVVQGNFIGTDVTGTESLANPVGVSIAAAAFANLIGGGTAGASDVITPGVGSLFAQATPHAGNLISSSGVGVDIRDSYTLNNRVEGNFIGTNGTAPLFSAIGNGVQIAGGAGMSSAGRRMGPATSSKARRPASVYRIAGTGTMDNHVEGNYIGTNLAGSAPLGNGNGVQIAGGASDNVIGGIAEEAG